MDNNPEVSVAFLGHFTSGKSTTAGNLIYKCGGISYQTVESYNKQSLSTNKGNSKFAWVLDTLKCERDRGQTIDFSCHAFFTATRNFTFHDTSGHRDFIKNAISGISQSDIAVLVVSAITEEFDAGFSEFGLIREHLIIAYAFGIRNLIVCVNKMDHISCNWSKDRFDQIKLALSDFLIKVGFDINIVAFIPISGWLGDNLIEFSYRMKWYKGLTLLEALDQTDLPQRFIEKPLRISIQNVYHIPEIGVVPVGRVEAGELLPGMTLKVTPSGFITETRSLQSHHKKIATAKAGCIVGFTTQAASVKKFKRGFIVSDANNHPAAEYDSFTAQIIVLNHPGEIKVGYCPVVNIHMARVPCRIKEILQKIDMKSGDVIEDRPNCIRNGDIAVVVMVPARPMCVERYDDCPGLGRFIVMDFKHVLAVGIVKDAVKHEPINYN